LVSHDGTSNTVWVRAHYLQWPMRSDAIQVRVMIGYIFV
jgi:hypothetical protein